MSPSATTVPIHELSLPQAVRGIPQGKPEPLSIVSGGATPTRAFLNDALLGNRRFRSSSKSVDVLLALLAHIVVLGGPILAGLYYTDTINLKQFATTFLVAPPPPPPPPVPAVGMIKPQQSKRVFISEGKLLAPTYIPKQVAQLKEAPIESDAFGGVPGGVPGGIPGGQLGGVIGGVIGGALNTGAKPVPPPTGKSGAPVRVGGRVRAPKAIAQVRPEYPALARQTRVQGDVKIDAILDEQGNVIDMKVVSGHPLLYQAAVDALKKWKYEPTYLNDRPIAVELIVTITFQLSQ
jgi:periplasmic protein TonB